MDDRFIPKKQVMRLLGISRATLDRRRKLKGFPKARKPTGTPESRCYWLESEVKAYMKGPSAA